MFLVHEYICIRCRRIWSGSAFHYKLVDYGGYATKGASHITTFILPISVLDVKYSLQTSFPITYLPVGAVKELFRFFLVHHLAPCSYLHYEMKTTFATMKLDC